VAQKTLVILEDDLDGGEADETVTFSLDGVSYEIDLSDGNAKKLRESLSSFVESARRTGGRATTRGRARGAAAAGSRSGRSAEIRAWAKGQGIKVNERGRIPAEVVEAYEKAHSSRK
jgi:Lsr2